MTTTPLPPLPPVEKEWCEDSHMYVQPVVPKYGSYEMQAYATQARADPEAENKRLREALHRIDSVAVFLPTFDVLHEGGIEAVTQNIVEAISKAVAALEKQP